MKKESNRANYTGISMPKKLMDEVKNVIEKHPEWQYRSRAEFIKAAVREKMTYEGNKNDMEKRIAFLEETISGILKLKVEK